MKVAIIGSRNIAYISLDDYVPANTTEIISGGAVGVDSCAAKYAKQMGIKLVEFLPEYKRYGRAAPILRNQEIVNYADKILVFWNGSSKGTLSVIQYAKKIGKPFEVILCK